jgi:hypothetical protein
MEDDLHGRRPPWKITSMEDNLTSITGNRQNIMKYMSSLVKLSLSKKANLSLSLAQEREKKFFDIHIPRIVDFVTHMSQIS